MTKQVRVRLQSAYQRNFVLSEAQIQTLSALEKKPMRKSFQASDDCIFGRTSHSLEKNGLAMDVGGGMVKITPKGAEALAAWRKEHAK